MVSTSKYASSLSVGQINNNPTAIGTVIKAIYTCTSCKRTAKVSIAGEGKGIIATTSRQVFKAGEG
jgi:spore germination protein GerM